MRERTDDSTEKKGRSVLLGNKDDWMIGSNPSVGIFCMAPSVPWPFLWTSLCYFFWNAQNEKCQTSMKWWEVTGTQKGISGHCFIQHLRKSGGQPRRWGSSPRWRMSLKSVQINQLSIFARLMSLRRPSPCLLSSVSPPIVVSHRVRRGGDECKWRPRYQGFLL